MITAWMLAYALGGNAAFTMPGFYSLNDCNAMIQTLKNDPHWNLGGTFICYPYNAPALALGQPVTGAVPNTALSTDANNNLAQVDALTSH